MVDYGMHKQGLSYYDMKTRLVHTRKIKRIEEFKFFSTDSIYFTQHLK